MRLYISLIARLAGTVALAYGLHAFLVAHVMGDDRHDAPLFVLCAATGFFGLVALWRNLK